MSDPKRKERTEALWARLEAEQPTTLEERSAIWSAFRGQEEIARANLLTQAAMDAARTVRYGPREVPRVAPADVEHQMERRALAAEETARDQQMRATLLADECGELRDENRDLLAENGRLRRALERKGTR